MWFRLSVHARHGWSVDVDGVHAADVQAHVLEVHVRAGKHLPDALVGPNVADIDRRGRVAERVLINAGIPGKRRIVHRGLRRRGREDGAVIARIRLDLDCPRTLDHEVAADRYRRRGRIDDVGAGRDVDGSTTGRANGQNAATMAEVSSVDPSPSAPWSRMLMAGSSGADGRFFGLTRPRAQDWIRAGISTLEVV